LKLPDIRVLHVGLALDGVDRAVGRIASSEGRIYFEYDAAFVKGGLEISPFMLKLGPELREEKKRVFDGLFGVFHDSLPDGWGRLVLDRQVERQGIRRELLLPLHRLAYVGSRGMGALTYKPELQDERAQKAIDADLDLARLSAEATHLLEGSSSDVLPELLRLAGSSGGARPKVVVGFRASDGSVVAGDVARPGFVPFLVKFRTQEDRADAGLLELAYSRMAAAAGVVVTESRVFRAAKKSFFGTRRFDRTDAGERRHVHSFSGLVHLDHRIPGGADYADLLKVTAALTKDQREVERAFRLMTFNVLAHNRDDHAKNFAFVMKGDGSWALSPAYDLTFSAGPGGEHWLAVAGEGKKPDERHLVEAGRRADLHAKRMAEILDEVRSAVSRFRAFAKEASVSKATTDIVASVLAPPQTGARRRRAARKAPSRPRRG
jgi:serine/threonine-protein kinase HipA